jgi:hypothetical protein
MESEQLRKIAETGTNNAGVFVSGVFGGAAPQILGGGVCATRTERWEGAMRKKRKWIAMLERGITNLRTRERTEEKEEEGSMKKICVF